MAHLTNFQGKQSTQTIPSEKSGENEENMDSAIKKGRDENTPGQKDKLLQSQKIAVWEKKKHKTYLDKERANVINTTTRHQGVKKPWMRKT